MCSRKKLSSQAELQSYTYPKLHTGKSWYIDFLAYDPAEGRLKRKKYTLDNIPTKTQRRVRAAELISSILKLLRTGWSPWVDAKAHLQTLGGCCKKYYLRAVKGTRICRTKRYLLS